jgi:formylglycine-generating enzyme required for sulfatase activity
MRWSGQYETVMGTNPSWFTGNPNLPVENVSWADATNSCAKLTEQERQAGRLRAGYVYRLPTEAEWERACRAGNNQATAFGNKLSPTQANFNGNYPNKKWLRNILSFCNRLGIAISCFISRFP